MASPIDEALAAWLPSPGWNSTLVAAIDALERDPGDGIAWAQIAMALGDTRQPALCFIVCLHARRLGQPPVVDKRLSAHMALAASDLGGIAPSEITGWLRTQLDNDDTPALVAARVLRACNILVKRAVLH